MRFLKSMFFPVIFLGALRLPVRRKVTIIMSELYVRVLAALPDWFSSVAYEKVAHEKMVFEKVAHEKVAYEKVSFEKVGLWLFSSGTYGLS